MTDFNCCTLLLWRTENTNEMFQGMWGKHIRKVVFCWCLLPLMLSFVEVIFQWGNLTLRWSSIQIIFHKGHLPLRSSLIEFIFYWGHLPLRTSFIYVIFHWGLLLLRSYLIEVISWRIYSLIPASIIYISKRWIGLQSQDLTSNSSNSRPSSDSS